MMKQKKTIWIINQYASTPETGMGGRHYYLATELAKQGHKVYLIAASYTHFLRKPPNIKHEFQVQEVFQNMNFVWVKLPSYHEAHSKQRVFNWFIFSNKIRKLTTIIHEKPDLILYSSPSLIGYLGSKWLANFYKAKYCFEVRDIWPLTLLELGGYSKSHPFIRLMQWIEDRAYKKSDFVISNLFNAVEHMKSRGMQEKKFSWIPNGFPLDEVSDPEPLEANIIDMIPKNKFIVGYTGTIGVANAIDTLIEAAVFTKKNPEIHYVLVGEGKEKISMQQKVLELEVVNITFIDSIPKKQIQSMLGLFDICYIGWHKNPLYRFGIAPNKIPEYLYAKKPIIHAFSGKGDLVKQANAGLTVEAENPKAIAEGIITIYNLTNSQREQLGKNGQEFVLKNFTYSSLAKKIVNIID